jgi:hypothetical protein
MSEGDLTKQAISAAQHFDDGYRVATQAERARILARLRVLFERPYADALAKQLGVTVP